MLDIRCECGKIVCQSDQEFIVVKCRHCKRYMFIKKDDDQDILTTFSHFADTGNAHTQAHTHSYGKHM